MVWESRISVVVVLGEDCEDVRVCPGEGEAVYYPLVVSGQWHFAALTVVTTREVWGSLGVRGLGVREVTLQSSVDGEEDKVQVFQYTDWPQHGEGRTV